MKSQMLKLSRAKVPACVRERTALERRVFKNEKAAAAAALNHFTQFPDDRTVLWLISRLVNDLRKKTALALKRGRIVYGPALVWSEEVAA